MLSVATVYYWNIAGRVVKRGERNVGFAPNGQALFRFDQTREAVKRVGARRRRRDLEPDYDNPQEDWEVM